MGNGEGLDTYGYEHKVSSFISLCNDIGKNLLLPNVGTLNVLENKVGDELPKHVCQVSSKSIVTIHPK